MNQTDQVNCRLVGFLPFTANNRDLATYALDQPTNWVYSHLAASVLAIQHFNEKNSAVVKELSEYEGCPVHLQEPVFGNSNSGVADVAKFLVEQVAQGIRYCAIVGPYENEPALEASHIAAGLEIPMITHGADDTRLSNFNLNPFAARTSLSLHPIGESVISWLRSKGRNDFLSIISVTRDFGDQYFKGIDNAAKESGFRNIEHYVVAPPFTGFEPNRGFGYAFQEIKLTGYRNIVVALGNARTQLQAMADYAELFGLNNGEYVWTLSHNLDMAEMSFLASTNANVSKLLRGMAIVRPLDGFAAHTGMGVEDPFLTSWMQQNASMVERINGLHPIQKRRSAGYYQARPNYFQTHQPEQGASFMYDAVMTAGIAKCKEVAAATRGGGGGGGGGNNGGGAAGASSGTEGSLGGTSRRQQAVSDDEVRPTTTTPRVRRRFVKGVQQKSRQQTRRQLKAPKSAINPYMEAIYDTEFDGASGRIAFGENNGNQPSARKRETAVYGAYNLRDISAADHALNTNYTTWFYLSDIQTGGPNGNWSSLNPFVFGNGLTSPPILNRDTPPQNFLDGGVQATGLAFMSFALLLILGGTGFILVNQKKKAILQSQPTFMYILMWGCFLMTSAIFTISFDEGRGWTDEALDRACLIAPWLVSLGYITMYSALFMKMWRLNKVLSFQRRKVEVGHVVGPFAVLLLAAVALLLAWSIQDPLTWNRTVVNEDTGESYGQCSSENAEFFLLPLLCLMACATLMCAVMACKTKDVDSRFSESKWIFYTIFVQIQVLILGIPVLVILGYESANATYLGRSLVVFVMVITVVLLMIGPKVHRIVMEAARTEPGSSYVSSMPSEASSLKRGTYGKINVTGISMKNNSKSKLRLAALSRLSNDRSQHSRSQDELSESQLRPDSISKEFEAEGYPTPIESSRQEKSTDTTGEIS